MQPLAFLDAIAGYTQESSRSSADAAIRIAVVDATYNAFVSYPDPPPFPKVTFEGESILSTKRYAYANGFIPAPGQRVWMVPIGNTYLIVGGVANTMGQGFYTDPIGDLATTEFGDGNYLEVESGVGRLVVDYIEAAGLKVNGSNPTHPVRERYWTTDRAIGITNTELTTNMDTGAYSFVTGRSYDIEIRQRLGFSVATDFWIFRLRENSASGTQRGELVLPARNTTYGYSEPPLMFEYLPAVSSSINFVWTAQRLAGTGNLNVYGGSAGTHGSMVRIWDRGPVTTSAITGGVQVDPA